MVFSLTYTPPGRGAFPDNGPTEGLGGTLNSAGTGPGGYYRAPAKDSGQKMPGLTGALALRYGSVCSINHYSVTHAVRALQSILEMPKASVDGIFGLHTTGFVTAYQTKAKITVDGVVGPQTCRDLFTRLVAVAATLTDYAHTDLLRRITTGTMVVESACDPGAVGLNENSPEDLGIAQINGVHSQPGPTNKRYISLDDRLNPVTAIPWMVTFIDDNLKAMEYDLDSSIAAYNLGISGARTWRGLGRPQIYKSVDVWAYIAKVKAGM